jgi:hypothetical protein
MEHRTSERPLCANSGRPEKDAIDPERPFSLLPQAVDLGSMQTDVRLIRINSDERRVPRMIKINDARRGYGPQGGDLHATLGARLYR